MRLTIPLTGRLKADGSGNPADPVRIIPLDLGDVAWQAIAFDFDAGTVEVEADVPQRPGELPAIYEVRKEAVLQAAQALLNDKTVDELHTLSGSPKLKKPAKKAGV